MIVLLGHPCPGRDTIPPSNFLGGEPMVSIGAYKVIHILGVLFVFASLGALILASRDGVERGSGRKLAGMTHGIAMLVVLIAGFGAMARLGMPNPAHWPLWVW